MEPKSKLPTENVAFSAIHIFSFMMLNVLPSYPYRMAN